MNVIIPSIEDDVSGASTTMSNVKDRNKTRRFPARYDRSRKIRGSSGNDPVPYFTRI